MESAEKTKDRQGEAKRATRRARCPDPARQTERASRPLLHLPLFPPTSDRPFPSNSLLLSLSISIPSSLCLSLRSPLSLSLSLLPVLCLSPRLSDSSPLYLYPSTYLRLPLILGGLPENASPRTNRYSASMLRLFCTYASCSPPAASVFPGPRSRSSKSFPARTDRSAIESRDAVSFVRRFPLATMKDRDAAEGRKPGTDGKKEGRKVALDHVAGKVGGASVPLPSIPRRMLNRHN